MSELDVARTAKRLGLTDAVICQLQAYGYLHRLDLTANELDARIYRAHLAHLPGRGPGRRESVEGEGRFPFALRLPTRGVGTLCL